MNQRSNIVTTMVGQMLHPAADALLVCLFDRKYITDSRPYWGDLSERDIYNWCLESVDQLCLCVKIRLILAAITDPIHVVNECGLRLANKRTIPTVTADNNGLLIFW